MFLRRGGVIDYYQHILAIAGDEVPIVLVFSKIDLEARYSDNKDKIITYFRANHPKVTIIETSAMLNLNIDNLRNLIVQHVLEARDRRLQAERRAFVAAPQRKQSWLQRFFGTTQTPPQQQQQLPAAHQDPVRLEYIPVPLAPPAAAVLALTPQQRAVLTAQQRAANTKNGVV